MAQFRKTTLSMRSSRSRRSIAFSSFFYLANNWTI